MEFTPRGEAVWLAVRDEDRVMVYDTESLAEIARIPAQKPSGIFFSNRANQLGL
jgi:protein NirF